MQSTTQITTVSGTQTASSTTGTSSTSTMGKDDFIKLLLTQLKNQDPLKPMDSTDFSAQLAQFSSVEQLMNISSTLTSSLESNKVLTDTIYNTLATNLIGKEVTASTSTIQYDGKTPVQFGFQFPDTAASLKVSIVDSSGKLVKSINKSFTTGDNTVSWDGTDNDGNTVKSGSYTIKIDAVDSSSTSLTVSPYVLGKITAIRYRSGETYVIINGTEINIKNLQEINGGTTNAGS